jgi:homoserine O-succinyltransferase/O-acetyltransferase
LFVHFQGHPEYGADTLFKEYRRDVKRYLRGERETYPLIPYGYFNRGMIELLTSFREKALSHRGEELLAAFPEALAIDSLESTWRSSAERIYANWLQYVASRKAEAPAFAAVARVGCETFRGHIE